MERFPRFDFYRSLAYLASQRSTCPRAQVGCILVRDGGILAVTYNGSPAGSPHCMDVGCHVVDGHCIRVTHAEIYAIAYCAREGISTKGATAYVTHQPCSSCAKALVRAGIKEVFFYEAYGPLDGVAILVEAGIPINLFHSYFPTSLPYSEGESHAPVV